MRAAIHSWVGSPRRVRPAACAEANALFKSSCLLRVRTAHGAFVALSASDFRGTPQARPKGDSDEALSPASAPPPMKLATPGGAQKRRTPPEGDDAADGSGAEDGDDVAGVGRTPMLQLQRLCGPAQEVEGEAARDARSDDEDGADDARAPAKRPRHLCGTFGCTLPNNHRGLHAVPTDSGVGHREARARRR